jgi:hypothetical protein
MTLLSGSHKFAAHWLFFQDFLDIFNEKNPRYVQDGWWLPNLFPTVCIRFLLTLSTRLFCSGGITSNEWNTRILVIALCVGLVASVKRLWMGFLLGKKAFGKKKAMQLSLNIECISFVQCVEMSNLITSVFVCSKLCGRLSNSHAEDPSSEPSCSFGTKA